VTPVGNCTVTVVVADAVAPFASVTVTSNTNMPSGRPMMALGDVVTLVGRSSTSPTPPTVVHE
jgi:hypothetical protein